MFGAWGEKKSCVNWSEKLEVRLTNENKMRILKHSSVINIQSNFILCIGIFYLDSFVNSSFYSVQHTLTNTINFHYVLQLHLFVIGIRSCSRKYTHFNHHRSELRAHAALFPSHSGWNNCNCSLSVHFFHFNLDE